MEYLGSARVGEGRFVRLDRGDLLLESLVSLAKGQGVGTCVVLSGIGSLHKCRMNMVVSTGPQPELRHMELRGALEMSTVQGIIAGADAHLHVTLSDGEKTYAGHLEEGSEVLYVAEIVLLPLEGISLERQMQAETKVRQLKARTC